MMLLRIITQYQRFIFPSTNRSTEREHDNGEVVQNKSFNNYDYTSIK